MKSTKPMRNEFIYFIMIIRTAVSKTI